MCLCVAYTQDRQFFQVFLHTRARSALNSRVRAGAREHSFCFVFVDGNGKKLYEYCFHSLDSPIPVCSSRYNKKNTNKNRINKSVSELGK